MPFSITSVPFECVPEGACTRRLSLRAGGIAAAPRLDFNLLRKSRFVLPLSGETRDLAFRNFRFDAHLVRIW